MIHQIFTIFDEKAKAYLPPFFMHHPAMAIRTFGDMCADKNHQFGAHPEDYTLYKIGEFDDSTALISKHQAPHPIITGLETDPNNYNLEIPDIGQIV